MCRGSENAKLWVGEDAVIKTLTLKMPGGPTRHVGIQQLGIF